MIDPSWLKNLQTEYWQRREKIIKQELEKVTGRPWYDIDPERLSLRRSAGGLEEFMLDGIIFLKLTLDVL